MVAYWMKDVALRSSGCRVRSLVNDAENCSSEDRLRFPTQLTKGSQIDSLPCRNSQV